MQPTESPFFANVGLGSVQAVQDQQDPDEDIARMTSLYSIHFASLKVQKTRTADEVNPVYNYEIITLEGNNYSGYVTSDGGYNDK
jgi:stage III sporulation protein SpoIIIAA